MKSYNLEKIKTFFLISILIISISCSTSKMDTQKVTTGKIGTQEVKPDYMIFSIGESGVEIKGTLKNYSKVKSFFVDSETHISMAEDSDQVGIMTDGDGNLMFIDLLLPQSTIKSDGSFSFKFKNLSEGNYTFFIQPIKGYGSRFLIDLRTLKRFKLTISNSGPETNLIEIGQVNVGKP